MSDPIKVPVFKPKQGDTFNLPIRVADKSSAEAVKAQWNLDRLLETPNTPASEIAAAIDYLEQVTTMDLSIYNITSQLRLTDKIFWDLNIDLTEQTSGKITLTAPPTTTREWKPLIHSCDVQFADPETGFVVSTRNFMVDVQKDNTYVSQ